MAGQCHIHTYGPLAAVAIAIAIAIAAIAVAAIAMFAAVVAGHKTGIPKEMSIVFFRPSLFHCGPIDW